MILGKTLEKALKIAKNQKTVVIVVEKETDDGFVIIPLDDYEHLIGESSPSLTGETARDTINREISLSGDPVLPSPLGEGEEVPVEEDRYYMEPLD